MNAPAVRFHESDAFHAELKRRVNGYFERAGVSPRGHRLCYAKTLVILLWLVVSYVLLVGVARAPWQYALSAVSLGLAMAGVGFNIQHDANHGAYSRRRSVNRLLGLSLDLVGGSSYIWKWKHNVFHHTYPNIVGLDEDIDVGFLARLAPAQPRLPHHRYQHIYTWALYGMLVMKWHFFDDFHNLVTGRIGNRKFTRPSGWDLFLMLAGKVLFFAWAVVVPSLLHPLWAVALLYAIVASTLGVVVAISFQLAHCVSEAEFFDAGAVARGTPTGWAAHQLHTTVDFAPRSRLINWYLGGLNFQIEHHLFPKICHLHYPALAPLVESTCREFGIPYRVNRTLRAALASHARWLRDMGRPEPARRQDREEMHSAFRAGHPT